jgi:DNA-binding HxlR family transcriptional regulator
VKSRRSYGQFCGIARALDLVGERWALLVVRELALGPKRFTDLREGLPGIATNVLSQRLRELERNGVVSRRRLPPPAGSAVYELTDYGHELIPILLTLGRWGARRMGARSPEETLRPEWLAVALMAFYEPRAAEDLSATILLELGDAQFTLMLGRGRLQIVHGSNGPADLTITADPETLVTRLAGKAIDVQAKGDIQLLERLPTIFPFAGEQSEAEGARNATSVATEWTHGAASDTHD